MEAEVVSMCINMFNGDSNCCGVVSEQMLKTKELKLKIFYLDFSHVRTLSLLVLDKYLTLP